MPCPLLRRITDVMTALGTQTRTVHHNARLWDAEQGQCEPIGESSSTVTDQAKDGAAVAMNARPCRDRKARTNRVNYGASRIATPQPLALTTASNGAKWLRSPEGEPDTRSAEWRDRGNVAGELRELTE